jgi:hypothetical protein
VAVFIELTTDPFEENRNQEVSIQRGGDDARTVGGRRIARRPLRGLEVKEDRVAAIKVVQSDGTEIPLVDAGSPYGDGQTQAGYTNFIIQSVTEARMEKHQIVETFGESYIFFFGEAPRFLDVQMVVVNSHDFNWEAEWWENYERFFRGTRLVEMGARLYMFYDDNVVEGYMLNSQASKTADQPLMVQMNFRLFLTGYRNITFVGNPQFPIRASVVLPDGVDLRDPSATDSLVSNLRDLARNDALAAGASDAEGVLASQEGGFTDRTRLSNYLRSAPASGAASPSTVQLVEQLDGTDELTVVSRAGALRGKIAENRDEFLGIANESVGSTSFEQGTLGIPPLQAQTIRTQQEVEDLWQESINRMGLLGADIDNPAALRDLGLMPLTGAGGAGGGVGGIGAGVGGGSGFGAGFGASFTPSAGASFGTSLTNSSVAANADFDQQASDPLGAVFGGGATAQVSTRATVQGGGDKAYGYESSFASGPGFGKPGYGDYGGNGHGSGQGGEGDPGFKSPDLFSYEGVSDNEAAFSRFNKPKKNNTVFGASGSAGTGGRIGLGMSSTGSAGGASSSIAGKPSSFSIISAGGSINFAESFSL